MLSDNKRVDYIVERYDGLRLVNVVYFDNEGDAVEVFQALCDEGHHCTIYRSEVMDDFYPDDLNLDWHSPFVDDDNPRLIKLDPPIFENKKENLK